MDLPVGTELGPRALPSPPRAAANASDRRPAGSRELFEREPVAGLTPNWFAAVMGTGIVAVAAARLPVQLPGLRGAAILVWALAAALLATLGGAAIASWARHPARARRHVQDQVMAHFFGAVPMALLTVGAATLLVGSDVIGRHLAVEVDWVLWLAGTVSGIATAASLPYLTFTRHIVRPESAFGGWLMPIVPPMVSASTGALLIPFVPAGQLRLDFVLGCYAMFGVALVASAVVITLIWQRLALYKTDEARLIPTLWIVLGPLGQSVTAANLLGVAAHLALPATEAGIFKAAGVLYGVPVLGFALLWSVIAAAITLRTARDHLPFSLTWWSFTFPVGTCVTGASALALITGSALLGVGALISYLGLVLAWLVVAIRTAHGSVTGRLLLPPAPVAVEL